MNIPKRLKKKHTTKFTNTIDRAAVAEFNGQRRLKSGKHPSN